jgi:hypothetical protein
MRVKTSPLFECFPCLVPVRFDHVACLIVNSNHRKMRAAEKLRVADCVRHRVRFAVPQTTEWQRIGNQIDAAFIVARADFVSVLGTSHHDEMVRRLSAQSTPGGETLIVHRPQ